MGATSGGPGRLPEGVPNLVAIRNPFRTRFFCILDGFGGPFGTPFGSIFAHFRVRFSLRFLSGFLDGLGEVPAPLAALIPSCTGGWGGFLSGDPFSGFTGSIRLIRRRQAEPDAADPDPDPIWDRCCWSPGHAGPRVCWLGPEPQGTPNHTFSSPNRSPWHHLGL